MTNPTTVILALAATPAGATTTQLATRLHTTPDTLTPILTTLTTTGSAHQTPTGWRLDVTPPEAISRYITHSGSA